MHAAFCLINFQEYERMMKSRNKKTVQEYQVQTMESWIVGVMGSDNRKPNRWSIRFRQWKVGSSEYWIQTTESWITGVTDSDDGKPESSEGGEGALNTIIKPGGKYPYLRVSCYFDVNYVKHNLHQSGGKLLTLDFGPLKIADDDQCSTLEISRIPLDPICCSSKFSKNLISHIFKKIIKVSSYFLLTKKGDLTILFL